jgi:hypothetical protein
VPANSKLDFEAILRTLDAHRVEFIVVGGVCAILNGAPVATFDLDIVHSRSRENVVRLLSALHDLEAYYRAQPDKRIRPSESHLSSTGHQLLMTRFGPLDVRGLIGEGREYSDLAPHSIELQVDERLKVRLLDLETLILSKQETAGEKDLAVLSILRRVLEEKSRG